MGRVKPSRLNSDRTRVRVKAEFRAGFGPAFVPTEQPSEDPMFRLRQRARALLRKQRQSG